MANRHRRAWIARFLIHLASRLSLRWAQRLGGWIGYWVWKLDLGPARITRINLERCFPAQDQDERERLTRRSLEESGKTLLETGIMWERPPEEALALIREVSGGEQLGEDGRGLVFLSPHLGNWELLGLYLASRFPVAALYTPPKLEALDDYMRAVRGRNGSELVPATQRGVVRLFTIVREGGAIAILPDQDPDDSGGVFVPLFGIPANTMKLVPKLAQKTNPRVWFCTAYRLPQSEGFRIVFREADPELSSADLTVAATALNRGVEAMILEHPEQYQWSYKRFKRRPSGERSFYDP